MVRAQFLITWACCLVVMVAHVRGQEIAGLGVNWGSLASHPLDPPIVVNTLKDNGVKKVKLFNANSWTLNALAGTDIEVMLGIPNDQLNRFARSFHDAKEWVKHNVSKHLDKGGVNIKFVAVGNEPFLKSFDGSYLKSTLPAMQNIQEAIEDAGLGDQVKVTVPLNADVYESHSNMPSDGDFRSDIHDLMLQVVRFLNDKKSPFLVNIYPFLSLYQSQDFPRDFAFFDGGRTITDNNTQYTNVFDANFDTLVWSLKKAGFPDTKIVVGEVGWPTDGDKNANPNNAKRFNQGFLKKMASKKGTPLHREPIEAYLFSLFDEDLKSIDPGNFERHWGIFRFDGVPKYALDFTGQGRDKMPIGAKGVEYQERKWCVLRKEEKDMSEVASALSDACQGADCSSLAPGSSCGDVDMPRRASYAFNQYFQVRDQSVDACDFSGMGQIVSDDPSSANCLFAVEIQSGSHMLKAEHVVRVLLINAFFVLFLTLV
ncbi:glucan endo-1,3-beta-glucosidase 5 [Neltuma alba]|uniref:glucan endo-1,3-beta-glucosidase 5 n=1 Tax=Neltuma alba TaxID=207710 RepID=UPI0010A3E3C3|nr:glucan endo-1,3-beta-glucosidase 5 [Prosopis alba]